MRLEIKEDIYKLIAALENDYTDLYNNTYISRNQLDKMICDLQCEFFYNLQCIAILYNDNDIKKIYYYGTGEGIISILLEIKSYGYIEIIVEVLGDENNVNIQSGFLKDSGAHLLGRYSRWNAKEINNQLECCLAGVQIRMASRADCAFVKNLLEGSFDKRLDHLPSIKELISLIDNKLVYIVSDENKEIGTICLKKIKDRYIYIYLEVLKEEYLNSGIGIIFLQRVLQEWDGCRFTSWTNNDNIRSNRMHEYIGFRKDGIVNDVYSL